MSRRQSSSFVRQVEQLLPEKVKRSPYYSIVLAAITLIAMMFGFDNIAQPQPESSTTSTTTTALPKGQQATCYISKIYDGDTVNAQCNGQAVKIRMVGIDAPEMKQAPYGQSAKSALQELLPKQFELHSEGSDRYQRTLGTLYSNGKNINLMMVEQGHAVAYADKSTPKIYREAEAQAKRLRRGVWREAGLHQDPKAWRQQNRAAD